MFPAPQGPSAVTAQPLPPLGKLTSQPPGGGGDSAAPGPEGALAGLLSGIAPIKAGVDQIMAGCKAVVQSGVVPGAEQICSQIVALASSLLPMAAQSALQPGGAGIGAGTGAPPGPVGPMPPPPGGPQPVIGA